MHEQCIEKYTGTREKYMKNDEKYMNKYTGTREKCMKKYTGRAGAEAHRGLERGGAGDERGHPAARRGGGAVRPRAPPPVARVR